MVKRLVNTTVSIKRPLFVGRDRRDVTIKTRKKRLMEFNEANAEVIEKLEKELGRAIEPHEWQTVSIFHTPGPEDLVTHAAVSTWVEREDERHAS